MAEIGVQSCPCYCCLSLSNVFNYVLTRVCAYAAELRLVIFLAVALPVWLGILDAVCQTRWRNVNRYFLSATCSLWWCGSSVCEGTWKGHYTHASVA